MGTTRRKTTEVSGITGETTPEPNISTDEPTITTGETTGDETTGTTFTIGTSESNPSGQPIKRGRGRPRKNQSEETAKTFIKQKQKVTKQDEKSAKELADLLIASFEYMSAMVTSQNTNFNEMEKFLLEPSLARMLQKMNFDALEKANRLLDPLFIFGALALWSNRVFILQKRERENAKPTGEISNPTNSGFTPNGSNVVENFNLGEIIK